MEDSAAVLAQTIGGAGMSRLRVGPALALLAAAALAVLVQWPNLSTYPALTMTLVCSGTVAFAAAGVLLWREPAQRSNAALFGVTAVLYTLDTPNWSFAWPHSPLPMIALIAGPIYALMVGLILLRYPYSRLARPSERWLVRISAAWVVIGATTFVVTGRPEWYAGGFPGARGQVVAATTWWITLFPDRRLSGIAITVSDAGLLVIVPFFLLVLGRRVFRESRVLREELIPVLVGAVLLSATIVLRLGAVILKSIHLAGTTLAWTSTAVSLTVVLIPIAFIVSAVRKRWSQTGVADLLLRLRLAPAVTSVQLRAGLRETLHDDSLEVFYWVPEQRGFVDVTGLPVSGAPDGPGVTMTVTDRRGDLLAVVHADAALDRHRPLLNAAIAASGFALENARLEAALRAQLEEVRASRSRIVEATLMERRRLERDLHDGAQQRLLAIGATLGRLDLHATGEARSIVEEIRGQLGEARADLRGLARGLHPAVLTHAGLGPAIETVTERLPLFVQVDVPTARWPPDVELSAYFVACEALTNAVKHAGTGTARVQVREHHGQLQLRVADAGCGGAALVVGGGLAGLRDRARALGGELSVTSPSGHGTEVVVTLPCG